MSFIFLTVCGGSSGDGGASISSTPTQSYRGFVVKGPLQNATVFADYDGDGLKGDNEPSVLTNSVVIH